MATCMTLTDEELAELVADGEATLVRKEQPDIRAELVAKRIKDFSLQPAELRQDARRRLAYVEAARLGGAVPDEQMKKLVAKTAGRIEDATPPSLRSLRRWLKTAGQAPVASALVPAIAARGTAPTGSTFGSGRSSRPRSTQSTWCGRPWRSPRSSTT